MTWIFISFFYFFIFFPFCSIPPLSTSNLTHSLQTAVSLLSVCESVSTLLVRSVCSLDPTQERNPVVVAVFIHKGSQPTIPRLWREEADTPHAHSRGQGGQSLLLQFMAPCIDHASLPPLPCLTV